MGLILIIILVLVLIGALPTWRHSKSWDLIQVAESD